MRLPVVQSQLGVEAGRCAHLAHAALQDSNRLLQTGDPEIYETLQISSTHVYSSHFRDNANILTIPRNRTNMYENLTKYLLIHEWKSGFSQ